MIYRLEAQFGIVVLWCLTATGDCRLSPLPKQVVGSEFDQHPKASWIILMSRYISEKSLQSPLYDTPLPALGSRPLRPSRAA